MSQSSSLSSAPLESRKIISEAYRACLAEPEVQFASLSQDQFSGNYGPAPESWRIGPFQKDGTMTFRKILPMDDPYDIGWKSTMIGNPTMIERDGWLHLFYRAYPAKESFCTFIGHARYRPESGWEDLSGPPALYPVESDELYSVEDAKLYRHDGRYFLFYNSVWRPDAETSARIRQGYRDWGSLVVTKVAVSEDLENFERVGQVVPYEISLGWSKGAVIPRNGAGEAVRIGGKFLMFLSEGCGDQQYVGFSDDLLHWDFKPHTYLELHFGEVSEVACCIAEFEPSGQFFFLDFMYKIREGAYRAGQALYHVEEPFRPLVIAEGGSLAWGGLLKYRGRWILGQGWDGKPGDQDLFFYTFSGEPALPD